MTSDALLESWQKQHSDLVAAVDLLIRWMDDRLDAEELACLRIDSRSFLLNVAVGGR